MESQWSLWECVGECKVLMSDGTGVSMSGCVQSRGDQSKRQQQLQQCPPPSTPHSFLFFLLSKHERQLLSRATPHSNSNNNFNSNLKNLYY